MGSIRRFDLNRITKDYHTPFFVETGTWKGDGVEYARQAAFTKILSVEIIPGIAAEAKKRFSAYGMIEIIEGDSAAVLAKELPQFAGNCIFWLDAHFPGADEGLKAYDTEGDEDLRLPLQKEMEIIKNTRSSFSDVFIIDDLRIYEDGIYENGNAPVDALPRQNRNLIFIERNFGDSHIILRSYQDEGYILLFPREVYQHHRRSENDYYLVPGQR